MYMEGQIAGWLVYQLSDWKKFCLGKWYILYPFTTKSDQFQITPATSPEILHYAVWRTWLFIAYSDELWSCTANSHYITYTLLFERLGECTLWPQGNNRFKNVMETPLQLYDITSTAFKHWLASEQAITLRLIVIFCSSFFYFKR